VLIAGAALAACGESATEPPPPDPVSSWTVDGPPVFHLSGVSGTSSSDVFAVGHDGAILHYDGTGWSEMTSGTDVWREGVRGTAAGDVYAVGRYGIILRGSR
jgi:hypothetical protein